MYKIKPTSRFKRDLKNFAKAVLYLFPALTWRHLLKSKPYWDAPEQFFRGNRGKKSLLGRARDGSEEQGPQ